VPIRHSALSPCRVTHSHSFCKSTLGHFPCSVYAFGTRPQVHYGPLALFSVYAFGTRQQAHCGSLVLFYLSMLSALDNRSSVGRLFCHLSMLSALDHKSSMGRLFCYLSILSALDHKSSMGRLFCYLSMLSAALDAYKSSVGHLLLVLVHRFRLLVSLFSAFAVSRHTKLTSLTTSGLGCLDWRLRLCLSLSRLLPCSCRLFLLTALARESNCCALTPYT
jgi:hypothetical protein